MILARSSGLPRPAKVIFVPGANLRGEVSHWSSASKVQVPPLLFNAPDNANPAVPVPISSPTPAYRLGPLPFAQPCLIVWQAQLFLTTSAPFTGSAHDTSGDAGGSDYWPPSAARRTPEHGA